LNRLNATDPNRRFGTTTVGTTVVAQRVMWYDARGVTRRRANWKTTMNFVKTIARRIANWLYRRR
jgi:hypothetical protein